MAEHADVTDLLLAWGRGDAQAQSALMNAVCEDLRRISRRRHHFDVLVAHVRWM